MRDDGPMNRGMPVRGAIDLAALAAANKAREEAEARIAAGVVEPPTGLVVDVTEATFQAEVIDRSFEVPVIIDLWATWCEPCKALSPILEKLTAEYAGRIVLAKIDVDAEPGLGTAFQAQSIPSILAVLKGQPVPLFTGAVPEAEVRDVFAKVLEAAAANGVNGRVDVGEPRADVADSAGDDAAAAEPDEPDAFDRAADAVDAGDWDGADAAFREILAVTPNDEMARAGLAQVAILRRTEGIDPIAAVAAANSGDNLDAVLTAADVEVLSGFVEEAFGRLTTLVRSTDGDDRNRVRARLLELFETVGNADPRVLKARTALASALF